MVSKVVIITGGAGEIGKSLVQSFAANDCQVIVSAIHQAAEVRFSQLSFFT